MKSHFLRLLYMVPPSILITSLFSSSSADTCLCTMRRMRRTPSSSPHLQLAPASTLASSSSQQDPSSHQETTQHDLFEHLLDSPSLGSLPPESSSPPAPAPPASPSPASSLAHTTSHTPPDQHLPPPRAPPRQDQSPPIQVVSSPPLGRHSDLPGDLVSSRGRGPSVAFLTRTVQCSQLPKASVHIGC